MPVIAVQERARPDADHDELIWLFQMLPATVRGFSPISQFPCPVPHDHKCQVNMTTARFECDVSFAVACYNAMPYLDEAIASALGQRDVAVEILVVDDGSSDGSLECARGWAARDPRVRVLRTPHNAGPGGARNLAIANMRGEWYAVLDSDDLLLPDRSRLLIDTANAQGADLVADDLAVFGDGLTEASFLDGSIDPAGMVIEANGYFTRTAMYGRWPNLGFLKPMVRANTLRESGITYNPDLRIAEDDEFIVRLLLADQRYFVLPRKLYRYRKHDRSISHRLSSDHALRMVRSEEALRKKVEAAGALGPAYSRRWQALQRAAAFSRSIDALKARKPLSAIGTLLCTPGAIRLYSMPVMARLKRMMAP